MNAAGASPFVLHQFSMNGTLNVCEIFHSIQGESSLSGLRFAFVRLTGCNLRCKYCDTTYAYEGGTEMDLDSIVKTIEPFDVKRVLITGGEPLEQQHAPNLALLLFSKGYEVAIETNGETPIKKVARFAKIIMDIKTPGSGMCREGFRDNLRLLKATDEIKFVITSTEDYAWAKNLVQSGALPTNEILFSPAGHNDSTYTPAQLAESIINDKLPVRLQLQLHKIIWGQERGR
jgi:7-carboxy-7-deazaguanine synthase